MNNKKMIEESQNFAAEQGKAFIKSYHLYAIFCFIFVIINDSFPGLPVLSQVLTPRTKAAEVSSTN